jgi:recombinational DNA repair ATPase RecF
MAYLKKVTFTDYTCFRGEHTFTFVDDDGKWCQWNVFLGNNNTGKTNLLRGIGMISLIYPKETTVHYGKDEKTGST